MDLGQQEKRQEFIPTNILYGPSTLADKIFQGTPLPWYKNISITWKPPTSFSNAMKFKAHPKLALTIPSTTPDSCTGLKQESIVEYGYEEEIYLKFVDAIIQNNRFIQNKECQVEEQEKINAIKNGYHQTKTPRAALQ
jgi:hypothetical protein